VSIRNIVTASRITVPAFIVVGLMLTGCSSSADTGSPAAAPQSGTSDSPGTSPSQAPAQAPASSDNQASAARPSTLAGIWSASDGSKTKTITDQGQCSGMYYNGTSPLDIGGPMSCTFSQSQSNGYYLLVVRQPPNQASYEVKFSDDNTMIMFTGAGVKIVTLLRQ
jgi:hypothetical protein